MTLNLLANTVTINLEVKMLKGQYTYAQNNNYNETSFRPWSEDLQPLETFMRIVRETQIEPNRYYLETIMNQSLYDNFATNSHRPKITVVEQQTLQEDYNNRQTEVHVPLTGVTTSTWQMILMMKTQNKQNKLLTNLPLQLVQEYIKIHEQMQIQ